MARRRMFSLDIVDTDNFLDMPSSTQALYFHLGMRADDDGFVSSPKRITKTVNCSEDDLKLLIAKKYLIPFESGVVVISDWKINNWVRPDRKQSTRYKNEKKLLDIHNDIYVLTTECQPNVNQASTECHTQDSIGKDSIGKDSIVEESIEKEKGTNVPKKKTVYFPQNEELDNAFQEFLTMRKNIKKPISTQQAITRMLNKIEKLSGGDDDLAIKIINQSTDHCWQDVYALKENSGSSPKTVFDEWRDA